MPPSARRWIAIAIAVALGAALAAAGAQGGLAVGGVPLLVLAVTAAYAIQWIVFIPSFAASTERFFDLTGSLTYLAVTLGLALLAQPGPRGWLLCAMVMIWAIRLGSFLFARVSREGGDGRFDELKTSLPAFLSVWTIQGLWVTATALAAWIAISNGSDAPIGWLSWLGVAIWLAGFALEVIADLQKSRFRADPANRGEFIRTGLWSRSRHPNYLGEILLWVGVAVVAAPSFGGAGGASAWQWVGLISPLFVAFLLTRVSGIPLLERRAAAKWGEREDYRDYLRTTPALLLRLRS